ncbi:AAA family ATPase [Mycobacterium sp. Y57]|uniref:ATP-binding protein n=1 Tax=Mycolicibacterium xanthum TaxID=2796469 RepID=UPI001C849F66|nr:adenylate/guanylate cyclase domain-containing protein [Mycolicibacterium xanthum]MBX7432442.1 AAA family ATPase [Mycolicibacterium xanthum]
MAGQVGDGARCAACGNDLRVRSRFCDVCGAPVAAPSALGEHKYVTVLFADVVGSMKLAAVLDTERLQEIMNELFNRSAAVVQRFQGTMDKFTGDGLMALFGAPLALEDHALRGCIAALEIQRVAGQLAREVADRDGIDLRVRVGLNSGEVIVGEIGTGPGRYTAVGHAVGMAQRMEAGAPAGGVLCSLTTSRLVGPAARMGPIERVGVKGSDEPVSARPLIAIDAEQMVIGRNEGQMFGREAELRRLHQLMHSGAASAVGVVGPPGVGKTRLVDEFARQAAQRGDEVVLARCDAQAMHVAFRALARVLRAMFAVMDLADAEARARVGSTCAGGEIEPIDVQILLEAMGIAEAGAPPVQVGADGWRRRLVNAMTRMVRARQVRTVFVVEDAHWVDAASDVVLADFAAGIGDTPSGFIATYRPEFVGALQQNAAQAIILRPLPDEHAIEVVQHLIGGDPSLHGLSTRVASVAGGNPFFIEEFIRDLADRGVLIGARGDYRLVGDPHDIGVPDTVQAVLAARIDRLPVSTKSVLNAASVIGQRFDADILELLLPAGSSTQLAELVATEMIDQTEFAPRQRYCFRHPLVRTVAYESQLTVKRSEAHRRLAAAIERRSGSAQDENAALIAAHLEAAGDFAESCRWHLRAADWLRPRDLLAARAQWASAQRVADQLPDDVEGVTALRIAPRTMLLSTELFSGTDADNDRRFDELRALCARVTDARSLAIAMAGRIVAFTVNDGRLPEAVILAAELEELIGKLQNIPVEELEILYTAIAFTHLVNGELEDALRIVDQSLELPLSVLTLDRVVIHALRGTCELCLGHHDAGISALRTAASLARELPPVTAATALTYWAMTFAMGLVSAVEVLADMREALVRAESFGDRFGIIAARFAYGSALFRLAPGARGEAVDLLRQVDSESRRYQAQTYNLPFVEADLALEAARVGGPGEPIDELRQRVDGYLRDGPLILLARPAEALAEILIGRGAGDDIAEARRLLEGWGQRRRRPPALDLWWIRVRALLAEADGDMDRYAALASDYLSACRTFRAEPRLAEAERMVARSSVGPGR